MRISFHALPARSSVYLMCGASEGVLNVGKAGNLPTRLSLGLLAKALGARCSLAMSFLMELVLVNSLPVAVPCPRRRGKRISLPSLSAPCRLAAPRLSRLLRRCQPSHARSLKAGDEGDQGERAVAAIKAAEGKR